MNDQISRLDSLVTRFYSGNCKSVFSPIGSKRDFPIAKASDNIIIISNGTF